MTSNQNKNQGCAKSPDFTLCYGINDFGNMIFDKNKGITTITYSLLNLPKKITFACNNTITYIYNVLGIRVRKTSKLKVVS